MLTCCVNAATNFNWSVIDEKVQVQILLVDLYVFIIFALKHKKARRPSKWAKRNDKNLQLWI